jgi:tRNA-uridine 2-sulfurtransferase
VVGGGDELLRGSFFAGRVNWISIAGVEQPIHAEVKIRNKHAAAPATLLPTSNPTLNTMRVEIRFDEPQRAVTPGQGAVFYSGDLVLGGGWIE